MESIEPKKEREVLVWDSELRGFGGRVFPSGRRSYFVHYRNQSNRTRRQKLGVHGVVSTEEARDMAKAILGDVAKGEDPSVERRAKCQLRTISDLADEYLNLHSKIKKTQKGYEEDQNFLNTIILRKYGNTNVADITTFQLQRIHSDLKATPYKANKLCDLLSKMFNLAIQWGWCVENPVRSIERYKEYKRERWLNTEELQRLWQFQG